jgi:3-phenylpropionate/cinnamic acid dioxygenase small subunit
MDTAVLHDKLEVHELLARYARGLDTRDWELWKSVFVPTAHIDYRSAGGIEGTRDDVAAWLQKSFEGLMQWSQHLITNIEVDIVGDKGEAQALFYNPLQFNGLAEVTFCGGSYHHSIVRTDDGWRSERLLEKSAWFVNPPSGAAKI